MKPSQYRVILPIGDVEAAASFYSQLFLQPALSTARSFYNPASESAPVATTSTVTELSWPASTLERTEMTSTPGQIRIRFTLPSTIWKMSLRESVRWVASGLKRPSRRGPGANEVSTQKTRSEIRSASSTARQSSPAEFSIHRRHNEIRSAFLKYGVFFFIVAFLLAMVAYQHWLILVWPAVSFGIISAGYLALGPPVYGKSNSGRLSVINRILLLPFLLYLWSAWYLLRLVKRENAFDQVTDRLIIGRRLLSRELPESVDRVVDLTSEFDEPGRLRNSEFHSFQILDGFVPTKNQLQHWANKVAAMQGTVYIHCAEGHGRPGLVAAAVLIETRQCSSIEEAIELLSTCRPLVRLGTRQMSLLKALYGTHRTS